MGFIWYFKRYNMYVFNIIAFVNLKLITVNILYEIYTGIALLFGHFITHKSLPDINLVIL